VIEVLKNTPKPTTPVTEIRLGHAAVGAIVIFVGESVAPSGNGVGTDVGVAVAGTWPPPQPQHAWFAV
jgi:hypothetical protein